MKKLHAVFDCIFVGCLAVVAVVGTVWLVIQILADLA